jgi:hypothetical protein
MKRKLAVLLLVKKGKRAEGEGMVKNLLRREVTEENV